MKRLLLILSLMLCAVPAFATTRYISKTGSDSDTGVDEAHPWLHSPYMFSATGNALSFTKACGDTMVFKGGETWNAAADAEYVNGMTCSSGTRITFTVDTGWYVGGSFTKPKFDAQYAGGAMFYMLQSQYVNINNLEFSHGQFDQADGGGGGLITGDQSAFITMTFLYVHGWRQGGARTLDGNHGGVILINFPGFTLDLAYSNRLEDSEVENSENAIAGEQSGDATYQVGTILRTTIHDTCNAVLRNLDFDSGVMYNVSYPVANNSWCATCETGGGGRHQNGAYSDPGAMGQLTSYVRNSKFYNIGSNAQAVYMLANGSSAYSVYAYNDIFYGAQSAQGMINVDPFNFGDLNGGNAYISNCLFYFPDSGITTAINVTNRGTYRLNNFSNVNNHFIGNTLGSNLSEDNAGAGNVGGTILRVTNRDQTTTQATAQGFAQGALWAPINGSVSTLSAGTDLSATFTTDYLGNTKTAGYWDIGPYQYQGTQYYVATATSSPAGSDSNPGTITLPFLTGEKVIATLTCRDTGSFRAGNYRAAALGGFNVRYGSAHTCTNWNDKITLQRYASETVTMTAPGFGGDTSILGFSTNAPYTAAADIYWKVIGISIRGDGSLDGQPTVRFPVSGSLGSRVWMDSVEVSNARGSCILPTSDYWIFTNMNVHNCGLTGQDHGLYWDHTGMLVDGGTYHDNTGYGIHMFHSSGCDGITECTSDNVIRNAALYDNARGTDGTQAGNLILSTGNNNSAYNLTIYGSYGDREVDLSYRCGGCTLYNSTIIPRSGKNGIVIDSTVTSAILKGNIIFTSGGGSPVTDNGSGTTDSNNLKATDPTFVNGTNHDYRLQSTSAARVANGFSGANLFSIAGLRTDKAGVARPNSAMDGGAFTYDSAPTCVPSKVVFTSQPTGTNQGASLGTISVAIQDSGSNTCTAEVSTITLSKHSGVCTGQTLNGTVSGAAVSGVFTTTNVNMTGSAGACSLDAASSGLTGATSSSFSIVAGSFSLGTSSATQGQTVTIPMNGTGTSWINGTTVPTFTGSGITVNSTTCSSAILCNVSITLSASAVAGVRDVTMTTNAEVEVASSAFNVLATPVAGNGGGFRLRIPLR